MRLRCPPRHHALPLQFLAAVLADIAGTSSAASTLARFALPAPATAADLEGTYRATRELLADALAAGVTDAKLGAALARAGVNAETRDAISRTLASSRAAVHRDHLAAVAALTSGAGGTLVDFDWEVRHAVASDTVHATALTLCRLTLAVADGSGAVSRHAFECTADEVAGLITTLGGALRSSSGVGASAVAVSGGGGSGLASPVR